MTGILGIASDLVKYDAKYEQIILNLLGRTVIVDNMDHAIALARKNNYSFRIVTVEGDVINPSGMLTGGSVAKKTLNILGRGREIESLKKELKNLERKIEDTTKKKQEYSKSIEDILNESEVLEKELQEVNISYATEKQKVVGFEENISKIEQRLEKLKQEGINLDVQKQELIAEGQEKQKQIEEYNVNNEALQREIEEYALLNKDNQKVIDDLNFDITNLKISVSSFEESESGVEEIAAMITQDIENSKLSIENKKAHEEEILGDNKNLEDQIAKLKEEIEATQKEVENSGEKIETLKATRTKKNEELEKAETDIGGQFETIESLKEQLLKMELKKSKIEQDLEQIVNKMWEEYELTPNDPSLDTITSRPQNIAATTKNVNSLRARIKELGSINIDSIEEYKNTKERYDFMCEQRLDLENSISKLKKVIAEMTSIMKDQFAKQFKIINQNFDEVFKELFGGGKAELILTDEENILDCGIDIQVQPTGKKLQNMMLLSGGEKAFTAIALLFAILKINPAPFCVLDEIEAALDEVNVYRFADYLKKFAKDTQFLVITHRKGTMEVADTVYGITMEENGISKLLSMKLK